MISQKFDELFVNFEFMKNEKGPIQEIKSKKLHLPKKFHHNYQLWDNNNQPFNINSFNQIGMYDPFPKDVEYSETNEMRRTSRKNKFVLES